MLNSLWRYRWRARAQFGHQPLNARPEAVDTDKPGQPRRRRGRGLPRWRSRWSAAPRRSCRERTECAVRAGGRQSSPAIPLPLPRQGAPHPRLVCSLRRLYSAKTLSKSLKPLTSIGFPFGSKKNIVRCSPGCPSKRTTGGMSKAILAFSRPNCRYRNPVQ